LASNNPIYVLILNGFKSLYERLGSLYYDNPKARGISRDFYLKLIKLAEHGKFDESVIAVRDYGVDSGKIWVSIKEDVLKELAE
jgi:GntR family negative regulator for fad regulon and positive regulator of fabA